MVGLVMRLGGMTADVYDALNVEMGFPASAPEGLLHHVAGPLDEGFQIVDIWQSREHYDRFVNEHLVPAMDRVVGAAVVSAPEIAEFPVHHHWHPHD